LLGLVNKNIGEKFERKVLLVLVNWGNIAILNFNVFIDYIRLL